MFANLQYCTTVTLNIISIVQLVTVFILSDLYFSYVIVFMFFQMVHHRKDVMQYVQGIAVHWYWDWLVGPEVISDIYKKYPDQFILYTESCMGKYGSSLLTV